MQEEREIHPAHPKYPHDRRPLRERLQDFLDRVKVAPITRRPFLEEGIEHQEDSGNVYPRGRRS